MQKMIFTLLLALALPLFAADRQFTASDGVTLHYHTLGSGRPVVVLSGGPGMTSDYMEPVGREVARHARAVLLEQRGTGHSVLSIYDDSTLTLAKAIDDLESLRRHLGVERLGLLGHSWGGMLAMAYAAAHPERVDRLILVESGGPTLDFVQAFGKRLEERYSAEDLDTLAYWRDPQRKKENPRRAAAMALQAKTPAYFYDRTKSSGLMRQINEESYDSRVNKALLGDLQKQFDLRDALRQVKAPVFIIQSKEDPLQAADAIEAALPQARLLMIDHSGHYPWIEQPRAFRRALDGALR